jgi:hypothetical protein
MDPTTCYQIILDAIKNHDYAKAREYATILKNWLESGGFIPQGFTFNEVTETIGRVLRPACNAAALRFPFLNLACMHCDAGDEVEGLEQAIDSGWTRIDPDVDSHSVTHVGLCPECRRLADED